MMIKRNGITAVVLATVLAGTGVAFAEGTDEMDSSDATAIVAAKVGPAQAIQSAEAKAGGKAVSLDFVNSDGAAPYYHVEVIAADGSEQNLAVDAASGEVMKAVGQNEHENGEESGKDGDADQR